MNHLLTRWLWLPCLMLTFTASAQNADQDPLVAKAAKLGDDFMGQVKAFNEKIVNAKDDGERMTLRQTSMPNPTDMIVELMGIINEDASHPAVPVAAKSVLQFHRMSKKPVDLQAVYQALSAHHMDSSDIALPVIISVYQRGLKEAEEFIEKAYRESNNDLVQGVAAFGLSQNRSLSESEQIAYLETALEKVGDSDYALSNGKKLSSLVEGRLRSLKMLAIGQVAPDIEGEDIDGVTFKLSDYRGKVVMLDFWGHW